MCYFVTNISKKSTSMNSYSNFFRHIVTFHYLKSLNIMSVILFIYSKLKHLNLLVNEANKQYAIYLTKRKRSYIHIFFLNFFHIGLLRFFCFISFTFHKLILKRLQIILFRLGEHFFTFWIKRSRL